MSSHPVQRGHVYRILIDPETPALVLVISSNAHNTRTDEYITLPISARRSLPGPLPSWVPLRAGDPAFGYVVACCADMVAQDELKEDLGALSLETLSQVEQALRRVLGL